MSQIRKFKCSGIITLIATDARGDGTVVGEVEGEEFVLIVIPGVRFHPATATSTLVEIKP